MAKKHITIPIFIPHMGCPHRCSFCNQWQTSATRSESSNIDISTIISRYRSNIAVSVISIELAFFGGSFTGLHTQLQEKLLSQAVEFLQQGLISDIRLSTRPDCIDREKLDLLRKYRVGTIELGVQSFIPEILANVQRGHTVDDVFQSVELIKIYEFNFALQLMPGLPGDTGEESRRSATIAANLDPTAVRIYPTVILKNTRLEHLYNENRFTPWSLEHAIEVCKDMYSTFLDKSIPVIRMGLHPLAPQEAENIIAGPYHPSFGFLVKSRVRRDQMVECIMKTYGGVPKKSSRILNIVIPFRQKEEYIGPGKGNIRFLQEHFGFNNVYYEIGQHTNIQLEIS